MDPLATYRSPFPLTDGSPLRVFPEWSRQRYVKVFHSVHSPQLLHVQHGLTYAPRDAAAWNLQIPETALQ